MTVPYPSLLATPIRIAPFRVFAPGGTTRL